MIYELNSDIRIKIYDERTHGENVLNDKHFNNSRHQNDVIGHLK